MSEVHARVHALQTGEFSKREKTWTEMMLASGAMPSFEPVGSSHWPSPRSA